MNIIMKSMYIKLWKYKNEFCLLLKYNKSKKKLKVVKCFNSVNNLV